MTDPFDMLINGKHPTPSARGQALGATTSIFEDVPVPKAGLRMRVALEPIGEQS